MEIDWRDNGALLLLHQSFFSFAPTLDAWKTEMGSVGTIGCVYECWPMCAPCCSKWKQWENVFEAKAVQNIECFHFPLRWNVVCGVTHVYGREPNAVSFLVLSLHVSWLSSRSRSLALSSLPAPLLNARTLLWLLNRNTISSSNNKKGKRGAVVFFWHGRMTIRIHPTPVAGASLPPPSSSLYRVSMVEQKRRQPTPMVFFLLLFER